MPRKAISLPLFLAAGTVWISSLVAVGIFFLYLALTTLRDGELLLTRRRVVPRLVTLSSDTVEFLLRCTFLALPALTALSFAAILLAIVIHRVLNNKSILDAGVYAWPQAAVRASLLPFAFFLAWFALLVLLGTALR